MKKTTLQIVENSDRFHVSENGVPMATFVFWKLSDKGTSQWQAWDAIKDLAMVRLNGGFKVILLPTTKK